MASVIGIYTGKDLEKMQSEGGSAYWKARTDRIDKAEYVILMRNHRAPWAVKDGVNHGQAFMIGKISGWTASKEYEGRKIIHLSEYALLPDTANFKKAWRKLTDGQRYPLAYITTDDLLENIDLDIESLEWSVFEDKSKSKDVISAIDENSGEQDENALSDIIAEAKHMVACVAGIDESKVSIQINF